MSTKMQTLKIQLQPKLSLKGHQESPHENLNNEKYAQSLHMQHENSNTHANNSFRIIVKIAPHCRSRHHCHCIHSIHTLYFLLPFKQY